MASTSQHLSDIGSMISTPFKILNLPFKSYRQYFGKPKYGEKYTGTPIQKARLKKITNIIFNCGEISKNDRLFMNMINDFLTQEGQKPIDHYHPFVSKKCGNKDIMRYRYRKGFSSSYEKKYSEKETEEDSDDKKSGYLKENYYIKFSNDFDPKSKSGVKFNGGTNNYGFSFLGLSEVGGKKGMEFTITKMRNKNESLIFTSDFKDVFGSPIDYKVYLRDMRFPSEKANYVGKVTATIIKI